MLYAQNVPENTFHTLGISHRKEKLNKRSFVKEQYLPPQKRTLTFSRGFWEIDTLNTQNTFYVKQKRHNLDTIWKVSAAF